jgi:hypothetical protein
MNASTPFRELPAGSAWNEAVRRATAISIAGYFIPNLLANFGVIPQLDQSFEFMPGVCGTAGVFLMAVSLFIGQYHRRLAQGVAVGFVGLILPYFVTWFRTTTTLPSNCGGGYRHLRGSDAMARKAIESHSRFSGRPVEE